MCLMVQAGAAMSRFFFPYSLTAQLLNRFSIHVLWPVKYISRYLNQDFVQSYSTVSDRITFSCEKVRVILDFCRPDVDHYYIKLSSRVPLTYPIRVFNEAPDPLAINQSCSSCSTISSIYLETLSWITKTHSPRIICLLECSGLLWPREIEAHILM